jgi:molecular chaperone GrpE
MINNDSAQDILGRAGDAAPGDRAGSGEQALPVVASLEQRIAALEAEKADLDNYKERIRRDMSEHEARERETILRDFLEVADNLERVIASWKSGGEKDMKSIRDGIDLVLRLFKSKLERYDVTAFDARGQPFDPHVHHAISQAASIEAVPGTVLHEVQKGYLAGERLLRPAAVVVAAAGHVPPRTRR